MKCLKFSSYLIIFFALRSHSILTAPCPPPVLISASADCSARLSVIGIALPNNVINVYANGVIIGSGIADIMGNFNFTIQTNLLSGTYLITTTEICFGTEGLVSNAISVNVPTAQVPTLSSANIMSNGVITVNGSGASANAQINVFANGNSIGTGLADASGNFNFEIQTQLAKGTYVISVTQTNSSGCSSDPSNIILVSNSNPVVVNLQSDLTSAIIRKYCVMQNV